MQVIRNVLPEKPFEGIEPEAYSSVYRNYWLILVSQFSSKLADALASAKIVLPWVMSSVGVPAYLTGLVVPIRESGSLIPQLLIGGLVRRYPVRKYFYIFGCFVQGGCLALMALAAQTNSGVQAGIMIIGLLIVFSLARGVCSITAKDVLGKTIPKGSRGGLSGISASLAGLVSIGVGILLALDFKQSDFEVSSLLWIAPIFWLSTAILYFSIYERPGEAQEKDDLTERVISSVNLLKSDHTFRHFVAVRALMMSSSLSAPYFIMLVHEGSPDTSMSGLGYFIIISGIASFISGPIWGRFADQSSRLVLIVTSICTAVLCVIGALITILSSDSQVLLASVTTFFFLSITHQGVRLGRKTYVVDLADGNKQTDYVSTSNSIIGLLLLVTGIFGAIAAQFSIMAVMVLFAGMAISATILGLRLPEAND
jgi:MFS family permease